jgi:hypothetical protein
MAEPTQALASFHDGYAEDGISTDGLPHYIPRLMITLSVPPYTLLTREANDEDFETYPDSYQLYKKQRRSAEVSHEEGYPLVLWPAAGQAAIKMLAARDIYTVEALAKYSERGSGLEKMPGELRELALRAKAMIDLSAELGQFEVKLRDRDAEIAVLKEQINELRGTIKAQDGMRNALKARVAA